MLHPCLSWLSPVMLALLLFFQSTACAAAPREADRIIGVWLTQEKDAKIEIYRSGDRYEGRIVWLQEPVDPETGKLYTDKKNPDPDKRDRPLMGLVLLTGLAYTSSSNWGGGTVYDPETGRSWSGKAQLESDLTLKFTGFWGISLIGRTETWTRSPG